ncbi:MAG: DUF3822 family protein [Muribaculaceae bacterium]|nr:DUF3822 family protein [Muribaculaceae bacterium]MBR3100780.1 DUF3822 family protein [Muribaculaceae bacterium]
MANVTQHIRIQRPELWTLQLQVERERIRYTLHNAQEENSLLWGDIPIDNSVGDYLKAVENAVYDNPALLDDYPQVRVLVHSNHFVVMPPSCDEDQARQLFDTAFPEWDGDYADCLLPQCQVRLAYGTQRGLIGFLQRTFNMPAIYHHLYPLCEHFNAVNQGSSISRMFLNLRHDSMDMVIYRKGRLQIANTFAFRSLNDAAYFALHAWESCDLNRQRDELQLAGDHDTRDQLAPELRRFIAYVMPAIYPAQALRLSHDATQASIDLIFLALCES